MLDKLSTYMTDDRAQTTDLPGVMIVLIIAGVVGFVGVQVMSQVIESTSVSEGDPLYNASQSLEDAIDQAYGLIGVAFIVVILSVVIVYLYGLRMR